MCGSPLPQQSSSYHDHYQNYVEYLNQLLTAWALEKWFSYVTFSTSLLQDFRVDQYLVWSGKKEIAISQGKSLLLRKLCSRSYSDVGGPGRMHNPTAFPRRWKKVCLSSYIGEAEFYWCCCYLFLPVYYVLRVCLRSQWVAFVTDKTKTGPCPKNSAELYRIFIVLISANSPRRCIAIILHQYEKSYSFKWTLWLSNLEIWLHY